MSDLVFVDTNVFVYDRDASEGKKQPLAREWLRVLWERRLGRTSIQVLNEYYVTVTRKLSPGLPATEAWEDVESLITWDPVAIDEALLRVAREIESSVGSSWWDSLILAAGRVAGCSLLLTEDMQDGQVIGDTRVVNPFTHTPSEVLSRSAGR